MFVAFVSDLYRIHADATEAVSSGFGLHGSGSIELKGETAGP